MLAEDDDDVWMSTSTHKAAENKLASGSTAHVQKNAKLQTSQEAMKKRIDLMNKILMPCILLEIQWQVMLKMKNWSLNPAKN